MPPTFRSSRSGRHLGEATAARTRTGQIDHDVFEGLPVRRWTRQHQTISQAPKPDEAESIFQGPGGKQTLPEHPMPRDSQLLTPTSKALLRAARAGCIYIRQAPKEAEDINLIINEEKEAADTEDSAAAAAGQPKAERSFVTRKWMTVPRQMEPPEVEFLAKRRPGLPSLYGAATTGVDGAPNMPMRRTRFKKVDPATGNVSVYEAWVPEGHRIEGEIAADDQVLFGNAEATVNSEAPAPGTVVEGVGTVNSEGVVVAEAGSAAVMTPPKRRPPPPKRKGKGFKGRRKKVMFAPGEGADASAVHGAGASARGGTMGTDGVKSEDGDTSRGDQVGHEDEDDDGEEGEESDEGDESMMDAKTPETPAAEPDQPSQTPQSVPAEMAPELQAASDASQAIEQASAPTPIPDKPSDEKLVPEDVTMTDYQPEPALDTKQPTASEQPAPAAETTTENQPQTEQPAPPAPEKLPEKPQETVKTEPDQQENQDAMDTSADQPLEQQPQQEQQQQQEQEPAPKPEPEQQEHDTAATENQDVDVLGIPEKSLDAPASSEQAEPQTKPEPEPEPEPELRQMDDSTEPAAPAPEPESAPAATAETGTSEEQLSTDNQEVENPAEEQPQPQREKQQSKEEVEDQPPVQQPIEQPQEQEQQQQPEGDQQPTGTPSAEPTEPTEQLTEQPAEQPAEELKEEPQIQQQADDDAQRQQEQQEQQPPSASAQEGEPGQN